MYANGPVNVTRSYFERNRSGFQAAVIDLEPAFTTPTSYIQNSVFYNNNVGTFGGALYLGGDGNTGYFLNNLYSCNSGGSFCPDIFTGRSTLTVTATSTNSSLPSTLCNTLPNTHIFYNGTEY